MQNIVYYFSGTGNSYFAARVVAESLGCECVDIGAFSQGGEVMQASKAVIILPSYAYGAPKPVLRFLKKLPVRADYLAVAVTCGSTSGGTLHSVVRVLKRRGQAVAYASEIAAPENFLPIFGTMDEDTLARRLSLLSVGAENFAAAVVSGQESKLRGVKPFSVVVSSIFLAASPIVALFTRVKKKRCTGCRVCANNCPCGAIKMNKRNKAVIKRTKCAICQRCLNICPQKCITFARLTQKSGRYFHPDVRLKDMSPPKKQDAVSD